MSLNKVIHESTRLKIMMILSSVKEVDFNFLLNTLRLTKGNLSSHMSSLEKNELVNIQKQFLGKLPVTKYSITEYGKNQLDLYWIEMENIKNMKFSK
jgi:DNA-binding transcriptional ArsR family regulator